MTLTTYSDADWVVYPDSWRSTSVFYVKLGATSSLWPSKRQMIVSHSSAVAEYFIVTHDVAECYWVRQLWEELHQPLCSTITIYCDNVSIVYMTSNLIHHRRTKHIEIDIHFVSEKASIGPSYFWICDPVFAFGILSL
jgi:hypothetical protein